MTVPRKTCLRGGRCLDQPRPPAIAFPGTKLPATPLARMARNTKNRKMDRGPKPDQKPPLAGPHAKPELTDKDKTAGTGMLPEPDEKDVEGPSG
jgi:hypothetical protein